MASRSGTFMAALLFGCAPRTSKAPMPGKLAIGVQTTRPEEFPAAWHPLMMDLSRKLGVAVELVTASPTETAQALAWGKVDVVCLGSSAAIDAAMDANARTFALCPNVEGVRERYVLMARADMPTAIRRALIDLFLTYGDARQDASFAPADNRILDAVSALKFADEKLRIEQERTLPPEQKSQRLLAVDKRQQRFKRSLAELR